MDLKGQLEKMRKKLENSTNDETNTYFQIENDTRPTPADSRTRSKSVNAIGDSVTHDEMLLSRIALFDHFIMELMATIAHWDKYLDSSIVFSIHYGEATEANNSKTENTDWTKSCIYHDIRSLYHE